MGKSSDQAGKVQPLKYESLMALKSIAALTNQRALEFVGQLVDASQTPRRSKGITKALEWADDLSRRKLTPAQRAELHYFCANAWDRRRPRYKRNSSAAWKWQQPALQEEIISLRRAQTSKGFKQLKRPRRCEITTNLANSLSTAGRVVECIELWTDALKIEPRFWMARGNRGSGLSTYAKYLYTEIHAAALFLQAHADLSQAINDADTYPALGSREARDYFEREKQWIERHVDLDRFKKDFDPAVGSMGNSKAERSYRQWCLTNRLFLDPLNEAYAQPVAAGDGWALPDFVTKIGQPPVLIGFFNQLKQEYATARWVYYSGTHSARPHFSDRHVQLYNTLDYPVYGLAIEEVRTAYRIAYSLLDKIGFFVNAYFRLKIPLDQVSFSRVWRDKTGKRGTVLGRFDGSKNLPLRGLYWLSKDLFDNNLKTVMSPDAQELATIRNHLEHRYLKVHDLLFQEPGVRRKRRGDTFHDNMAYSVSRKGLEEKTLRVLKLARSAMIYLALAMRQEELRRARANRKPPTTFGQSLPVMEHQRKR